MGTFISFLDFVFSFLYSIHDAFNGFSLGGNGQQNSTQVHAPGEALFGGSGGRGDIWLTYTPTPFGVGNRFWASAGIKSLSLKGEPKMCLIYTV